VIEVFLSGVGGKKLVVIIEPKQRKNLINRFY